MEKHKKNKQNNQNLVRYGENIGKAKDEIVISEYVAKIKRMITSNANHKEKTISLEQAVLARNLVNNMSINNAHDCFLYFSSLNLLNAYVKKTYASNEFKKNYFFKPLVAKGIEQIVDKNIQNVRFSATRSLCMINVEGLQFSYHCVFGADKFNNNERNHINDVWEGIRLQPYAYEVFETAQKLPNLSPKNNSLLGKTTETTDEN